MTYSWYYIRSNEVLSKNEEEVATKRRMKNLKKAMHRQDKFMLVLKKKKKVDNYQVMNNHGPKTYKKVLHFITNENSTITIKITLPRFKCSTTFKRDN